MKARPILFSAPMVRALLEGRKTQTRRLIQMDEPVRRDLDSPHARNIRCENGVIVCDWLGGRYAPLISCPYGQPGDLLWVKEGWRPNISHSHGPDTCDCGDVIVTYKADGKEIFFSDYSGIIPDNWTMPRMARKGTVTSLFMPRWVSRLTLEITEVRVERLQDISYRDCDGEGAVSDPMHPWRDPGAPAEYRHKAAREAYQHLWESINGPGSWAANSWVWALTFRVHQQNVDAFLKSKEAA